MVFNDRLPWNDEGQETEMHSKRKEEIKAKNERGNSNQNLESITCFQILPRANPGQKISR